jgi:hypothetical protein
MPTRATTRVAPTNRSVGATLVVAPVRLKFRSEVNYFYEPLYLDVQITGIGQPQGLPLQKSGPKASEAKT